MTKVVKIKDVTNYLETLAPGAVQESYDNSGLLTGDAEAAVTNVLVTLDCTESVVEEAVRKNCNLIIAHHPILFRGIKKLTGSNYVERTLMLAIRNNVAIYAIHTNLDNVAAGVNKMICEKIGLNNTRILVPRRDTLLKLVTFVPVEATDHVLRAMYDAGAGKIGHYRDCSFRVEGTGTFTPDEAASPHIGAANRAEEVRETRVEVLIPAHLERKILAALRAAHPYEEVAYYMNKLENENQEIGAGMIGEMEVEMEPEAFLARLKSTMDLKAIRFTPFSGKKIKKVAVCGGSGSFLLKNAIRAGADAFVSADFKYHEFFDAEGRILIADIGHYESEVYTKDLLHRLLNQKFSTFAVNFSDVNTNPISYYTS